MPLLILLLALAAAVLPARAQPPEPRPNILLILSDDHAAAHLGCYGDGNLKTPNLDRLAAEGLRFNRMYVAAPQCVPSRAALMTGRSPVGISMTRFSAPLPREVITYPELLRTAGYFTGICGRGYHLDGSRTPPETETVFQKNNLRTFKDRVDWLPAPSNRQVVLGQVREFLAGLTPGQPFFLQVGFSDPHRPFDEGPEIRRPDPASLKLPAHFPDTPQVRADLAAYYGEVQRLDGDVGRLLQILKASGRAEQTMVVFMGDNGAALLRGKGTLYEYGVRVPFLVRWPGRVAPGAVSDVIVSGEDPAPTFLAAAGVTAPTSMTGQSFLPVLTGRGAGARQYAFSERGAHGGGLPTSTGAFDLGRCVIGQRYKLIYNALPQLPYSPVDFAGGAMWRDLQKRNAAGQLRQPFSRIYFPDQRPMFELYDLKEDPAELNNLAGEPEAATTEHELKAALQEWMILERDYLPLPVPPPPARR